MKRRGFITLLGGAGAAWPLALRAQQPAGKPARIGVLSIGAIVPVYLRELLQGLRDLGYVEGHNLVIEYRSSNGQPNGPSAAATELVRAGVDLIFANGSEATRAAKQGAGSIPNVMARSNPGGLGVVPDLSRPEGKLTRRRPVAPASSGKR